jgi:hypothetical protein
MKMSKKSKTEKLDISFNARAIVEIRNYNFFQDFESLNTLRSLKALKADTGPLPEDPSPYKE